MLVHLSSSQLLLNLAERAKLRTKMNAMFAGEHINNTEDRAVLHTALRAPRDEVSAPSGQGVRRFGSGPAWDVAMLPSYGRWPPTLEPLGSEALCRGIAAPAQH